MKKLIILLIATAFSAGIFATPFKKLFPDTSAKIRSVFHRDFPQVNTQSMEKVDDIYIVSFKNEEDQSSCRVFYDADGTTLQTVRVYQRDQLAPFIRDKIESKYKDKKIFMVTDVATANEHYYEVMLENSKSLWIVHAKDDGTMFIQKKFKKSI